MLRLRPSNGPNQAICGVKRTSPTSSDGNAAARAAARCSGARPPDTRCATMRGRYGGEAASDFRRRLHVQESMVRRRRRRDGVSRGRGARARSPRGSGQHHQCHLCPQRLVKHRPARPLRIDFVQQTGLLSLLLSLLLLLLVGARSCVAINVRPPFAFRLHCDRVLLRSTTTCTGLSWTSLLWNTRSATGSREGLSSRLLAAASSWTTQSFRQAGQR